MFNIAARVGPPCGAAGRMDRAVPIRDGCRRLIPDLEELEILRRDPASVRFEVRQHLTGKLTTIEVLRTRVSQATERPAVVGIRESLSHVARRTVGLEVNPSGFRGDEELLVEGGGFVVLCLVLPARCQVRADVPSSLGKLDGRRDQLSQGRVHQRAWMASSPRTPPGVQIDR